MKKILTLLLVMSMILALAACGGKEALSAKEFNNRVTRLGYELDDPPSQAELTSLGITEASVAWMDADGGDIRVEYAIFQDRNAMMPVYNSLSEELEEETTSLVKTSGTGWEKCRLRDGNETYVLIRVDNALLYIEAWKISDAEIDKLLSELGY